MLDYALGACGNRSPFGENLVGGEVDVIIYFDTLATDGAWPRGLRAEVMQWVEVNLADLWREWHIWHR